jgi:putative restriction endonuclease
MSAASGDRGLRIWLVLTFGEDREYAGNAGYDDSPGKWYSYDSFVANHRQVAIGHCVILCDRLRALGIARIETIVSEPSTRVLQRCPVCQHTGIKRRKTKQPEFRCERGHEFETPARENASCTKYTADFGGTFTPFTEEFGRDFLRPGCPRYSDQLAMQEFDFLRMEAAFRGKYPRTANLIDEWIRGSYPQADAADATGLVEMEGYTLTEGDERESVTRQILARRGQQGFRDKLRLRYGDQCAISGCKILHVLEAAHISPYRGEVDNHVENGLLLRADLHTLFDLDLIGIEPVTLTVHCHPAVNRDEYRELHGRELSCSRSERPSEQALKTRWTAFEKRRRQQLDAPSNLGSDSD